MGWQQPDLSRDAAAMPRITAERVEPMPISREVARALLDGRRPPDMCFAEGYPSEFSLETMTAVPDHAGPGGPFFVIRRSDGVVIGEIGCAVDGASGVGQVGYTLVEPVWGQGFATEALRTLLRHLIVEDGLRRVQGDTFVDHVASRRVMEKAGMTPAGEREELDDGVPVRLIRYALDAGDGPLPW
jgi:RimJ/RimL family protein N-acetyltransferase